MTTKNNKPVSDDKKQLIYGETLLSVVSDGGPKFFGNLVQGSEEWFAARLGLLTASEMKHIITPKTLEYSKNDKERAHLYELAAQRITQYVEPSYVSDDMLRGQGDEYEAKVHYAAHFLTHPNDLQSVGFITNDKWGFTLGYSPDGLVCNDGAIECKSRRQKFQIETILTDTMPTEYVIQVQTGLLVSERQWVDFVSYSGGLPLYVKRIYPDTHVQAAILTAAHTFHEKLAAMLLKYKDWTETTARLIPTERKIEQEIVI